MFPVDEPRLDADLIRARLDAMMTRLRAVATAADRPPDAFRLVAVTKGFGLDAVLAAHGAGLRRFGENRVQEALSKVAAVPDAEWHLVGRLQANKVRAAVRAFAMIHSVDSLDLLQRIDRISGEEGISPSLLLQVNVSGEATKGGVTASRLDDQLRAGSALLTGLAGLRAARVVGLMTIAPFGVQADEARAVFATLRRLRDDIQAAAGRELPELSMGMTGDADAAVAEGATLVRIGTAIFGPRPA